MTHYTHKNAKMHAVPMSGNIADGPSCRLQPWAGGQSRDLAKVPACWLVPRLPLVAHVALLDYGIPPIADNELQAFAITRLHISFGLMCSREHEQYHIIARGLRDWCCYQSSAAYWRDLIWDFRSGRRHKLPDWSFRGPGFADRALPVNITVSGKMDPL